MMTKKRAFVTVAALAAASLLALAGCAPRSSQAGPGGAQVRAAGGQQNGAAQGGAAQGQSGARRFGAIPVLAVTVNVGPLKAGNDTAATVAPVTQSNVASQVAGVVQRVVHLAGDWVKAGEIVVQLDPAQLKLSVANAQAALDNAKINYQIAQDNASQNNPKLQLQVQSSQSAVDSAQKNYDAQKALFAIGGAPSSAVDNALSQLQQAQANVQAAQTALDQNKKADVWTLQQSRLAIDQAQVQLDNAQLNLRYASVSAPFTGQIAAVNVNPGVYVSTNTTVFIIVSADKEINFNVPPADAPNLLVGTTVQFTYQGRTSPVRISQAPSAPINGVVPMVATIPRSFSAPYGAVGTVTYSLTLAHGAIVPIAALQTNEDQNYVFTIEGGKAVMKIVKIVGQSGTVAAVAGIEDGVQLIMSPPPGLLAGSAVQVTSTVASQDPSASQPAAAGQQRQQPMASGQPKNAVDPPGGSKAGNR
ncbi:MAG TPA: HlyD family efflux transporter periplasmic adaptor subunit [Spirochaetia bacterium]|nr:HlyD family efflux transporter periplasmic adaptor subunit [Spirochaetia bacterium]